MLAHVLAARGNTAEAEQAWLQLLHESSSSAGGTAEGESPPGGLTPHWLLGGYGKLLADQHRYQVGSSAGCWAVNSTHAQLAAADAILQTCWKSAGTS